MSKTLKLIGLFGSTILLWGAGAVLFVGLIVKTIKESQALATFEAPGMAEFQVLEPGKFTVWHDYRTFFDGRTIGNQQSLPGGYEFELLDETGAPTSTMVVSRMTTRFTSGNVEKLAIGTFDVATAGNYQINVKGPDEDRRIISISKGQFKDFFSNIFLSIAVMILSGILGLLTLIFGIVVLVSQPKSQPLER